MPEQTPRMMAEWFIEKISLLPFLHKSQILIRILTVEETIFAADNETLKSNCRYEKALENPDDAEAYQKAFEEMDILQAWDFESQYKQIFLN